MPKGKIAGFDRPLAESEIIIETALRVSSDYGRELENDDFRAEQEEVMMEMMTEAGAFLDRASLVRDFDVKLNPAGSVLGVQIATGTDEISFMDIEGVEFSLRDVIKSEDDIKSFAIPTGVGDVGTMVDEMRYTVSAN